MADANALNYESTTSFTLNVQVTDGGTPGLSDTAVITVNLNDINETPTINDQAFSIDENSSNGTVVGTIVANDPDSGANGSLNYTLTGGTGAAAFNVSTGGLITVADANALNYESTTSFTLNVQVTDGGAPGLSDTAVITVNLNDINDRPTITSTSFVVAEPNTVVGTVMVNDEDLPGDSHSWIITGNGADDSLFSINSSTGDLTFNAPPDFENPLDNGNDNQYEVEIRVTDAAGASHTRQIDVFVTNTNSPPTTSGLSDVVANEDDPPVFVDLRPAFADAEDADSALTYTVQSTTNPGLFRNILVNTADRLRLDFVPDASGTAALTIRATDTGGAWVETTLNVTVNPVNDEQSLDVNRPIMVNEGGVVVIDSTRLSTSDIDNAPGQLQYTIATPAARGWISVNGTRATSFTQADIDAGLVRYHHDGSETVSDQVDLRVDDGAGSISTGRITITINPVNDAPVAGNDSFTTLADQALSESGLLDNDADAEGDLLTAILRSGPANGTVSLNPDGSFTYVPNPSFTGTDSFVYQVSDGTDTSNPATVVVVVAAAPPPPPTITPPVNPPTDSSRDGGDDVVLPDFVPPPGKNDKSDALGGADDREGSTGKIRASIDRNDLVILPVSNVGGLSDNNSFSTPSWFTSTGNDNLSNSATPASTGAFGFISTASFLEQNAWLWDALDENREQLETEASIPTFLVGGTAALASTLTAGYLIWLIKGGQLVAALMANLPAWQLIDPLPILNSLDDEDVSDDQSLEEMIESGNADFNSSSGARDESDHDHYGPPSNGRTS